MSAKLKHNDPVLDHLDRMIRLDRIMIQKPGRHLYLLGKIREKWETELIVILGNDRFHHEADLGMDVVLGRRLSRPV